MWCVSCLCVKLSISCLCAVKLGRLCLCLCDVKLSCLWAVKLGSVIYITLSLRSSQARGGAVVQWLKLSAHKVGDRRLQPRSGIQVSMKQNVYPLFNIVGSLRDREIASSASDRQGSNVWRAVSSHSSHHPQEVLLAHISLYVHVGGIKQHLFHVEHNTLLS